MMAEDNQLVVLFFQAEDGIRDYKVTGVQTCALPILSLQSDGRQPDHCAGAMIGLPTVRLQRHSITKERAEPFGPPSGNSVATLRGSVVSRPAASSPQPGGISRPASRALMTFPIATVEVDISSKSGGRFLAGNAIPIGLGGTP